MIVPVHNLNSAHVPELKAHFDALDSADTHLRFGNCLSRAAKHQYVERIDFLRDNVFGVYADDLTLLGVRISPAFPVRPNWGSACCPHIGRMESVARYSIAA